MVMQFDSMRRAAAASLLLATLALAGCAERLGGSGGPAPLPAAPSGRVTSAPLPGSTGAPASGPASALNMAGRWTLSSPGTGLCGMNFIASAKGTDGAIAPEGGCPGDFFTSRSWSLGQNGLTIRDHNHKTLARLAPTSPPGGFQGQAVSGLTVTLQR